jgi:phage host-nuclease inhibitor protein Gam
MSNDSPKPVQNDIRNIESWEDCDVALGVLRRTDALLTRIAVDLDEEIAKYQQLKMKRAGAPKARRDRVEAQVTEFATTHRDELDPKKKSVKLTHGTIAWKKAKPAVEYAESEEATMRQLKVRGHLQCIRVKEELDKNELAKLPAGEARLCGVVVTQTERLSIKLADDPIVEYPGAAEDLDDDVEAVPA